MEEFDIDVSNYYGTVHFVKNSDGTCYICLDDHDSSSDCLPISNSLYEQAKNELKDSRANEKNTD